MTCRVWINDDLVVLTVNKPGAAMHEIRAYCQRHKIEWKPANIVARNFPAEGQFLIKDAGDLHISEVHNAVHLLWVH